jgi:hypothetical protein
MMMAKEGIETPTFTSAQLIELETVGATALKKVEDDYGTGYPDMLPGQNTLSYHTLYHSKMVADAFGRMAITLELTPDETAFGKMLAKGHDAIQDGKRGNGDQERRTGEYLADLLRRKGLFSEPLIESGQLIIQGTTAVIENGHLAGQEASRMEYPAQWVENIALSLACADIGEILSATGPRAGHDLYKELNGWSAYSNPPMDTTFRTFQEGQIGLAQDLTFAHERGEEVFGGLRSAVVEHHVDLLQKFDSGQIEQWSDLATLDNSFIARLS